MNLLQVQNLSKAFGGVKAVQQVSFDLQAGELLALIGPNGAGKSTTFNMVGGQLAPDSGQVLLNGQPITGLPPRAIWRKGVGRTFQIAQTFASLSVVENVQMALLSGDRRIFSWWPRAASHRRADALHRRSLPRRRRSSPGQPADSGRQPRSPQGPATVLPGPGEVHFY